jgi:hypothetical protein
MTGTRPHRTGRGSRVWVGEAGCSQGPAGRPAGATRTRAYRCAYVCVYCSQVDPSTYILYNPSLSLNCAKPEVRSPFQINKLLGSLYTLPNLGFSRAAFLRSLE